MDEPAPPAWSPRLTLLVSRLITFVALCVELLLLIDPALLNDIRLACLMVASTALGYVLLSRSEPKLGSPRAARFAFIWLPALSFGLVHALGYTLLGTPRGPQDFVVVLVIVTGLTLPPASLGYALVSSRLPARLRPPEPPRPAWLTRPVAMGIALAWLPLSRAVFWWLTGATVDTSCSVDGLCHIGVPMRFASFGARDGARVVALYRLVQNFALIASLVPLSLASITLRPRWPFVLVLAGLLMGIGWTSVEFYDGTDLSRRIWSEFVADEL